MSRFSLMQKVQFTALHNKITQQKYNSICHFYFVTATNRQPLNCISKQTEGDCKEKQFAQKHQQTAYSLHQN